MCVWPQYFGPLGRRHLPGAGSSQTQTTGRITGTVKEKS